MRIVRAERRWLHWSRSISGTAAELQYTLLKPVSRSGIGLHSGKEVSVTIFPALAGKGRFFTSKYAPESEVLASVDFVVPSKLSTCLARGDARFCTVEHLLSALEGLGIDNCRIQLEGSDEVPLLDGSAFPWVEAIKEAGTVIAEDEFGGYVSRRINRLQGVVHVHSGESFVAAFPASQPRLTCGIDFPKYQAIGTQWFSWNIDPASYVKEVAPSRTFGLYEQIEELRAAGLIKGGSLENSLVCCIEKGWLNPPLRYHDEPCRHKLLDLLGDISLCCPFGQLGFPVCHIVAYKASHSLHLKFCKALQDTVEQENLAIRSEDGKKTSKSYKFPELGPIFVPKRFAHVGREKTSFVDLIYRIRHRKKDKIKAKPEEEAMVQMANKKLVNRVVSILDESVYVDELPQKLFQYRSQLSKRDIALVLKLVADVRLAFGFFSWIKDLEAGLDLDVFLTLVHRLLAARKWDHLNDVVDWMHEKNFYLDYGLFEAVMKRASDSQQLDVCEKWYKLMLEIHVKPNAFIFNLMIRTYNRHGRYLDALKVLEDMEVNKVKPTVVTYSQLFSACKGLSDPATAKALVKRMKIQGIKLDRMGHTTLMNVYAKAGQPDQVEELFTGMNDQGIIPDIYCFNCLLESYVKANLTGKATEMFDCIGASGCKPNEATYVIMLGMYCRAALYDKASQLLKTIDHDQVRLGEQFYITLIKAHAAVERWDEAIEVFNEMQSSSCSIRGSVYVLMMEVAFKAGYYEACEEIFSAVIDKGINRTPAVYETMIRACERTYRVPRVVEVFVLMQDMLCPFTTSVYELLHQIFSRTGNWEMLAKLEGIKEAGKVFAD